MLEPLLKKLRTDHPNLKLRAVAIDGFDVADQVLSGEIEIGFAIASDDGSLALPRGVAHTPLCRDWFRLVMPIERFDGGDPPTVVRLDDFKDEDFILPPASDACGQAAFRACVDAGFDPNTTHRVGDYPIVLRLVGAGAGSSLVPDLGLREVPDTVVVAELEVPRHRVIELIYRSSVAQRPAIAALIATVQKLAVDMGLDTV